jgi:hypothetical protein
MSVRATRGEHQNSSTKFEAVEPPMIEAGDEVHLFVLLAMNLSVLGNWQLADSRVLKRRVGRQTGRVLDKQALRKLLACLCLRKQASSGLEIGKQASNLGCLFACLCACLI